MAGGVAGKIRKAQKPVKKLQAATSKKQHQQEKKAVEAHKAKVVAEQAEATKQEEKVEQKEEEKAEKEEPAVEKAAESEAEEPEKEEKKEGDAAEGDAPKKTKKVKTKANRLVEAQEKADNGEEPAGPRGVMYVGSIPKGFFEPQMRKYFSQFGDVTNCRHSRSKKNANSKGYGWVEFAEEEVARIAAKTMNGYLLFGNKLNCHIVEKDKVHEKLWKVGKGPMKDMSKIRRSRNIKNYNERPKVDIDGEMIPLPTTTQVKKKTWHKADAKLKAKLALLNIDFDSSAAMAEMKAGSFIPVVGSPKTNLAKAMTQKEVAAVPDAPLPEAAKAPVAAEAAKAPVAAAPADNKEGKKRPAEKAAGKKGKKAKTA